MSNIFLLVSLILTILSAFLIILHRSKIISFKSKPVIISLYSVLIIGIIYIGLSVFGRPLLNKINAYRDNVLEESEEECKKDDAPFWCDL